MWSDWLVFCVCGFHSVCPLMKKDKRLMEASWWRDWLRGRLDLVLMGGAVSVNLSSNFQLMAGTVFPPCYLTWGQTMVEVMKKMVTSFKRSCADTAALSAPDPAASHPRSMPLPETPGHSTHDITRWSIPKSDWLYSLQPKVDKLHTVSKNKTRSWLWLRWWTPYCQIQT